MKEEVLLYAEKTKERIHGLHKNDIIYCNTAFIEELGYYYELKLGELIFLHTKYNNILEEGKPLRVVRIFKEKKYLNKKWWQFWLKQEETVTGYHLEVI